MSPKPETVIITGGAGRLGFELVKASLEMGFSVVVHHRSSCSGVKHWLKLHPRYKERTFFIRLDLTRNPAILIDRAMLFPITLVGLINNASVFVQGNTANFEAFKSILAINTMVPLALSERFFKRVRHGWIINMTDAHTQPGNILWQNYRITKRFLGDMTNELARAYAPRIRVNALAPGLIMPQPGKESETKKILESMPLKKGGSVEDLVAAYSFLVRSESVTGQTIHIDGGWHL